MILKLRTAPAILAIALCGYAMLPATGTRVEIRGAQSGSKCSTTKSTKCDGNSACTGLNEHCSGSGALTCFSQGELQCSNPGCTTETTFSCS
ncbi:hypothetical protein SAMN05444166_2425 [Singulisphaera sp. GP187]|nr:hypothetical protein SAMN05444166_2425 [Singulisphaera sp. GP187]